MRGVQDARVMDGWVEVRQQVGDAQAWQMIAAYQRGYADGQAAARETEQSEAEEETVGIYKVRR
jgi:hypothetical protein